MTIEEILVDKLSSGLEPAHLEVVNESAQHNVPAGSETHFKVVVVAGAFEGKPRVAQHRMVYGLLSEELSGGVHALALHTYTPRAWEADTGASLESPRCLGGKAREIA